MPQSNTTDRVRTRPFAGNTPLTTPTTSRRAVLAELEAIRGRVDALIRALQQPSVNPRTAPMRGRSRRRPSPGGYQRRGGSRPATPAIAGAEFPTPCSHCAPYCGPTCPCSCHHHQAVRM